MLGRKVHCVELSDAGEILRVQKTAPELTSGC